MTKRDKPGWKTSTWRAWAHAKQRCYNPRDNRYYTYGARGIRMCRRWRHSFENFYADMGECPPGYSLERLDNDGPYSPENCRWIPRSQQSKNRSTNRYYTLKGKTKTLTDWAKSYGMNPQRVRARIVRHGWDIKRALTEAIVPPQERGRRACKARWGK